MKQFPKKPKCRPTPGLDPDRMRVVSLSKCDAERICQAAMILRSTVATVMKEKASPEIVCAPITEVPFEEMVQCVRGLRMQMPTEFELCCSEKKYFLRVRDIDTFRVLLYDFEHHIACCLPNARLASTVLGQWIAAAEHCRKVRYKLTPSLV
jgi:hypothetical protein